MSFETTVTNNVSVNSNTTDDVNNMTSHLSFPQPMSLSAHIIVIVSYSAIIVASTGGNLLVIITVVTNQRMKSVINYFILNLACADILIAVVCIPFTFIANVLLQHWPFGKGLCKIFSYAQVSGSVSYGNRQPTFR